MPLALARLSEKRGSRSLNWGYLFLAINIAVSVSFGHIMKWSIRRGCDIISVGAINYVVGAVIGVILAARSKPATMDATVLVPGLIGGLAFFVSFFLYNRAIRLTGVSISTIVIRLSVMPAVLASMFYWQERLTTIQLVGVVAAAAALPLLTMRPSEGTTKLSGPVWPSLLALFFATSGSSVAAKAFQVSGTPSAKPLLVATWFVATGVLSLPVLWQQRRNVGVKDLPFGVFLGAVNVLGNFALISALENLPGSLVFPVASVAGVLLVTVSGAKIWGEKLNRVALSGVGVSMVALLLINMT